MTCCTCGQLCFLTPSSTMDLLVVEKGVPSCKCRWTHITRKLLRHLQYSDLLSSCDLFRLLKIIETLNFPFHKKYQSCTRDGPYFQVKFCFSSFSHPYLEEKQSQDDVYVEEHTMFTVMNHWAASQALQ